MSEHIGKHWDITSYSSQISEIRDWVVRSHELSTLDDVLLLSPYGFSRVKKFRLYHEEMKSMLLTVPKVIYPKAVPIIPSEASRLSRIYGTDCQRQ